ncbi:MAG: fibronectin type III domain-containing protein [Ilumatobacteraceae bacterium]|nr:fibronectin type III domain-containing protein [Ilumatobacteraceae bacterium]
MTNISTITSITQTSSTVCTVIAVSTATTNGVGVVSTLTAAASFSMTDTAGNAQTTLAGSPQSVTVTRNGEPDAPVISSVTAGNAQVVVAWSAPATNGAAISDYVVQYSTSSSGSYTPFADGTSTSTSATVTGLTNSTAYYFKVAATNSVGTGSYSAASAAATPTLPTQTVTWSPTTALTTAQSPNTPLAASSSGDGAITYAVQSAGATGCAINSSTRVLTFTAAGSCVVRATAATTSNYLTGYIDATFTVTAATCATGGVCAVGNTGPGGGIVFYVQAAGGTFTSTGSVCNTTCKYLEAAPTGWGNGISVGAGEYTGSSTVDPILKWCSDTSTLRNATTKTAIGDGRPNTTTGVTCTTGAIFHAELYTGNGKTDWHLPSKDELNKLYTQKTTVGGFSTGYYWSSSEYVRTFACSQSFSTGTQTSSTKDTTSYVRPVRAFG